MGWILFVLVTTAYTSQLGVYSKDNKVPYVFPTRAACELQLKKIEAEIVPQLPEGTEVLLNCDKAPKTGTDI